MTRRFDEDLTRWEGQIREIDDSNNCLITNIGNLFGNQIPKLRPRYIIPNTPYREDVINAIGDSMTEFLTAIEMGNPDMGNYTFIAESPTFQQAKIAGRTAIAATLTKVWKLFEKEYQFGVAANKFKVKYLYLGH